MLNEFGSYAGTLDNTKNDLTRKSLVPERTNCCGNAADLGTRPPNISVPSATWNCNPYLGNFYNYYNNSYDISDIHQYDNEKCGNQFSRNYGQHAIQSASVLQCCDPRCQLFSDHAKYPFSANLASKYGQHNKRSKNCYGIEPPKAELKPPDHSKYVGFSYPVQNDLNKYNGQQQNYNALYQKPMKPSKHVLLPESTSFNEYYTDIGKPSYWNNKNIWNRNAASYYAPFEHEKMPKMTAPPAVHEQNANNGILLNRLLDARGRSVYDGSYMPNYHCGRQSQIHKGTAYNQSYDRDMYAECNTRLPLQNNSYQPLPLYNVHYLENNVPYKDAKEAKSEEKSRVSEKNPPSLDVREFLSTWDDVEDEKAPEAEAPVIVLDCTSLEGDALAKVKEKLGENITDCNPVENSTSGIEFNSHAGNATVLKVVDDTATSQENSNFVSKPDRPAGRLEKPVDSSQPDGFTWYGPKKKDDLSYDLVEMTERLVNTVDKLFGEEKQDKDPFYETTKEVDKNEDQWNINFNYKRNKADKPPVNPAPDQTRYRPVPKEDVLPANCKLFLDCEKEPEKNVSCSFNLQKTSNDVKFSVNYSKQTECYSSKVQDYSLKYKNCEAKKPSQRVEDYSYKNYYNSYYYNNPSCEFMQMENVKECTYDVENIDKQISSDNASDITNLTLVKADLEKSLKEITHQFSYQKKMDSDKAQEKCDKAYEHHGNQTYLSERPQTEDECKKDSDFSTSVIQKTGLCVMDKDDPFNENSLLSMPSLSPPHGSSPEPKTNMSVGLTLNDVYEDQVIFDTSNKSEEEGQIDLSVNRDAVYPLNLTKETKPSVLKFTGLIDAPDEITLESGNDADPVFKADDGYYSVEPHFDKDSRVECDDEEKKSGDGAYKTCIVSREQHESSTQISEVEPLVLEDQLEESFLADQVLDPVLNLTKDSILESDSRLGGQVVPINYQSTCATKPEEELSSENELKTKVQFSSTDDERLLNSSKFKKYKKHKKLKRRKSDKLVPDVESTLNSESVIRDNGSITCFKHIFKNIPIENDPKPEFNHLPEATTQPTENHSLHVEDRPETEPSLPILVAEEVGAENDCNLKKRKFSTFVKETDLPVKKRKQDRLAGMDNVVEKPPDFVETNHVETPIVEPFANISNHEPPPIDDTLEKSAFNGKYPVESSRMQAHSRSADEENASRRKKNKKKHKKDKHRNKVKPKKQKKEKNLAADVDVQSTYNTNTDTKSPDRTMLDDEFNDPYKFQSSGTEIVVSNHEKDDDLHATPDVELTQNGEYSEIAGEDEPGCETFENVPQPILEKISIETTDRFEHLRQIHDLDGEHEIAQSCKKINRSRKKRAWSDSENYMSLVSRSCKKLKNVLIADGKRRSFERAKNFGREALFRKFKSLSDDDFEEDESTRVKKFRDYVSKRIEDRATTERPENVVEKIPEPVCTSPERIRSPGKLSLFELDQPLSPLSPVSVPSPVAIENQHIPTPPPPPVIEQTINPEIEIAESEIITSKSPDNEKRTPTPPIPDFTGSPQTLKDELEIQSKEILVTASQSLANVPKSPVPEVPEVNFPPCRQSTPDPKRSWSTENSPTRSIENYEKFAPPSPNSWTPIPSDVEDEPEVLKKESPLALSDSHKSIWSHENSPVQSDEEFDDQTPEKSETWNAPPDFQFIHQKTVWSGKNSPTHSINSTHSLRSKKSVSSRDNFADSETDEETPLKSHWSKRNSICSEGNLSEDEVFDKSSHHSDTEVLVNCEVPTPKSVDSSNCDETEAKIIDDFFNIPSVAPTPNCDLSKDEVEEPKTLLSSTPTFDKPQDSLKIKHVDICSKAPSPNCVLEDHFAPLKSPFFMLNDAPGEELDKDFSDSSSISSVAPSPNCDIIDGVLLDDTDGRSDFFDKPVEPLYQEVLSLRSLTAKVLSKMSFNSVSTFNRNNLLEVWVTPESTEIIIHSEETETDQTDLVITNDNHLMITDASYEDEDLNIAPNFDKIKEISFDYMGLESIVSNEKSEEDVQCQCLIISSEESIVCLRCSLNSSIIVNQDLNDLGNDYGKTKDLYESPQPLEVQYKSSYFSNKCIEDSFIDQKLTICPEYDTNSHDLFLENEVSSEAETESIECEIPESSKEAMQLKVEIPWHKIFNLDQQTALKQEDQEILELGPAQIEVRLSPNEASLWKLVNSKNDRVSPVLKVKRLVLQRATDLPEKLPDVVEKPEPSISENDLVNRLPKIVIKKTSCKEYKSYLQMNTRQPVVKLIKSKSLDELALRMCQQKGGDCSINLKKFKWLSNSDRLNDELFGSSPTRDCEDEPEIDTTPVYEDRASESQPKPEYHHCLLCHRSFTSEESYQNHIKGRFHRHLEMTQRKTIHAIYRHFTGHICPRLRPLSAKERKRMKWKPRSANVNHFYHQKTPLQIALHKSVFGNKSTNQECS